MRCSVSPFKTRDKLEVGYDQLNKGYSNEAAQIYALTSIAISMKRIADALEEMKSPNFVLNTDVKVNH